ncbi:MAG TPA: GIY-YIG nuclease family protein [Thermoanaerobaculia bacterium]|nr:GIY-YIG nuclease family protein [Thermoanaerobaculia bacterium]
MPRDYFVYILANWSRTLYVGVTNDLERRLFEHREGLVQGFTRKYRIHRLVYFEVTTDVLAAISREKQLKSWRRCRKVALIELAHPGWRDLSEEWGNRAQIPRPSASE